MIGWEDSKTELILSKDVLTEIFSHIPFHLSDWLNLKLICKKWKEVADLLFDPNRLNVICTFYPHKQGFKTNDRETEGFSHLEVVRLLLKDVG